MIALLVLTLMASDPGCLEDGAQIDADGQGVADTCMNDVRHLTRGTAAAWAGGDLAAAGDLAIDALDAYRLAGCQYHANAAQLGFVAGLALIREEYSQGRYFFWIARKVNDMAFSLNWREAELAEYYADYFGTSLPDDALLFNSPYLGRGEDPPEMCEQLPALRLQESALDDFALIWVSYRSSDDGEMSRLSVDYSFPEALPRSVISQIRTMRVIPGIQYVNQLLEFSPCIEPIHPSDDIRVCLPGFDPIDDPVSETMNEP